MDMDNKDETLNPDPQTFYKIVFIKDNRLLSCCAYRWHDEEYNPYFIEYK
jgi:hypothetical protein